MFGLNQKSDKSDDLTLQVHAVTDRDIFAMAKKLWDENSRLLHTDQNQHKEFLRFGYAQPQCKVWLQRDIGRTDTFELIVNWENGSHEICVVAQGSGPSAGDLTRPKALLTSMLTTPSVVLSNSS